MEIVLRRAGDLAFLFQNYEFAYNNYYSAKRDLSREQAPTFYAGVLVSFIDTLQRKHEKKSWICFPGNVLLGKFHARHFSK